MLSSASSVDGFVHYTFITVTFITVLLVDR